MLRRLGIRGKVLAALAVPIVVLFGAASIISAQSIEAGNVARAVNELVSTADELGALTSALQVERQEELAFLANPAASRDALYAARAVTDTKSAEYAVAIAPIDVTVLDPIVGENLRASRKARDTVPTMEPRFDVVGALMPAVVDAQYTAIIKAHVGTARAIADVLSDRSLAKYLDAYGLVGEAREAIVHELPSAVGVITTKGADARAVVNLAPSVVVNTALRAQARTAVNQLRLTKLQLTTQDASYASQRLLLSSGNASVVATMDLASFQKYSTAEINELAMVGDQVLVLAVDQAESNQATTVREARLTIAATLLVVFISIAIAFLIAGQIVVPLRRLTKAVGDVREALPLLVEQVSAPGEAPQFSLVQIPVTSRDEVGRLARAFNDVNATTIQIAQEQAALRGSIAEMFVNVARRDQVLLNRQISFIDALEQTEEDPNVLGNLFRLDHLATRMRRNAESLLVLAGIESGRRMRDAMPLSDVIRTASSEIEQYDRVQLELGIDPPMVGFSSLAAAHLLAELLENATVFSEPGTPVEVATSIDGEYVQVVVRDHGLGMSDEEIVAAQLKIRSTAAGDVLGAQRLGFYVVGRLALRLKAHVIISKAPNGNGTVVAVRFPARLFELSHVTESDRASSSTYAEPEPPVVEAVDLAALTDGETSFGLPRRRSRQDVEAQSSIGDSQSDGALPVASEGLDVPALDVPALDGDALDGGVLESAGAPAEESDPERDGRMFVLPPLEQARLTPELAVRTGGWAPEVPASATGSRLPNRADALRKPGVDPTVPQPSAPKVSRADRGALFGGFRGRAADVPPPADRPPLDLRTIPGAHDVAETDIVYVDPELAIDDDDDDAFTIPQLEPDEEPWVPQMQLADSGLLARVDAPQAPTPVAPTPVVVAPVVVAPAATPVATPPAFESTLNEARAWGAEDLSASSWQPAPAPGEEPVVDQQVIDEPVIDQPVQPEPVLVADLPVEVPAQSVDVQPVDVQPLEAFEGTAVAAVPEAVAEAVVVPPIVPAEPASSVRPAKRHWFSRRSGAPAVDLPQPATPVVPDVLVEAHAPVEPFVPEPFVPRGAVALEPDLEPMPEPADALPSRGAIGRHGQRGAGVPDVSVSAMAAVEPDLRAPVATAEPAQDAPRSLQGFFGRGAAVTAAALVAPEVAVVVGPEPELADDVLEPTVDPTPLKVPWAPTSVAKIIGEALDAKPAAEAPVADSAANVARGRWGRKPGELLENAPWFASATELPPHQSDEDALTSVPALWRAMTGEMPIVAAAQAADAIVPLEPPAPVEPPAVEAAPAQFSPAQFSPVQFSPAPFAPVAAPVAAAAVTPPADVAPAAGPLPIPEVLAAAKSARRGPRSWLGHKSSAGTDSTSPALPTRLPTREAAPPVAADPAADAGRWTPSVPAPHWTPQRDLPEDDVYTPTTAAPAVPSGGWAVSAWTDQAPAGDAPNAAADNRGVPTPALPPVIPPTLTRGGLDADVAAMLALRSDIQEQAFAELGQLAAYRPSVVGASGSNSLKRRVPTAVPLQAPQPEAARATTRDAAQLRSRLSSFQSGTSRGRIEAEHSVDNVPGDTNEPTGAGTVITRSRTADASGTSHEEEE